MNTKYNKNNIRCNKKLLEEKTCVICQNKFIVRIIPIKGRKLPRTVKSGNRVTCSKKCAREFTRLTMGKRKERKIEILERLKDEKKKDKYN